MAKSSINFAEAAAHGLLATDSSGQPALGYAGGYVYDLFSPAARSYAFEKMRRGYVEQYGLHHWWLDCDEPCGGTNNGSFGRDFVYANGTWPAALVGAAYPHMLAQMIYEGEGAPGQPYEHDNVMLGRSAWAGSQRFGTGVWSGDTRSTWDDFNQQFKAGLNMAMSGVPYWTTDIGGFAGGDTTSDDFRELIVRWFQWGAFCPLFRLHGVRHGPTWPPGDAGVCGATPSNEIWSFGDAGETAIVRVMRMREQLRPYVMEQFVNAADSGTPGATLMPQPEPAALRDPSAPSHAPAQPHSAAAALLTTPPPLHCLPPRRRRAHHPTAAALTTPPPPRSPPHPPLSYSAVVL